MKAIWVILSLFAATASSQELEQQVMLVFENAGPGVVNITSRSISYDFFLRPIPQEGSGSGFVYDRRGHIVTNYHVIEGARELHVTFYAPLDAKTRPDDVECVFRGRPFETAVENRDVALVEGDAARQLPGTVASEVRTCDGDVGPVGAGGALDHGDAPPGAVFGSEMDGLFFRAVRRKGAQDAQVRVRAEAQGGARLDDESRGPHLTGCRFEDSRDVDGTRHVPSAASDEKVLAGPFEKRMPSEDILEPSSPWDRRFLQNRRVGQRLELVGP